MLLERRADEIVERFPVAAQRDLAGLEAREIEHIGDELRHLAALASIERASSRRVASSSAAPCVASVLPAPAITASGVRRSCEIDASSVLRRLSLSAATRAPSAAPRAARARARAPIWPAKVSSRWSCSGSSTRRRLCGSTASTPSVSRPVAERQVQRGRGRQRVGAEPRAPAVIRDPLRDREIRAADTSPPSAARAGSAACPSRPATARRARTETPRPRASRRRAPCSSLPRVAASSRLIAYSSAVRRSRAPATRVCWRTLAMSVAMTSATSA